MSLKKIGSYNDLPKDFKQPKLKKGETAIYRLVNSVPDPVKPGVQRFPASVKIRTVDRVKLSPDDSETYDIGLVKAVDKDGAIKDVRYFKVAAQEEAGYFRVVGGNIPDEELFCFLEMCNENGSNPNRDEVVPISFVRVDEEKEAVELRKKRTAKLAAMNFAALMSLADVKQFAAARNWDQNDREDVLRQKIEKFAETEPEAFMKSAQDKDLVIKATIKKAIDNGTISFVPHQTKWVWTKGGETIALVPRGSEPFEGLCDFIKTDKRGDAVYTEIAKGQPKAESKPADKPKSENK